MVIVEDNFYFINLLSTHKVLHTEQNKKIIQMMYNTSMLFKKCSGDYDDFWLTLHK